MADISSRNLILKARSGSIQSESVDLSQMPDIFEYEWQPTTETYKVILKDGYDVLEVNDLIAADTTVNGLTITSAGSKFYSPVSEEESIGTLHFSNRTISAWDVTTTTASQASPGTWDLSSLIPTGTKAVLVSSIVYINTTSEHDLYDFDLWDYEFGAWNNFTVLLKGSRARMSGLPASSSPLNRQGKTEAVFPIGSSRKLYYSLSTPTTTGGNAILKGYYI